MPCLAALVALIAPRFLILVLWFFTTWFRGTYHNLLWPILGFIFLPTTMLWYSAVLHWWGGQWSVWPIAGLVVALLVDLSPGHHARRRRRRVVVVEEG